ncbi:YiiX/YebB-like N1pC/P60 family cysteine hydrolase [Liquorilactobacillus sicerae]|uniref:YiiX/YebB-like N1pC/P60 family cysteine hydrolase n=1 Tax=Liquorilactobacillus sicerae TaxID=1416943 RepID=UPI003D04472B
MLELKTGDLLFIQASTEKLSRLIAASTKDDLSQTNYTHVALIKQQNRNYFVLHADQKRGCIRQSLADFLADQPNRVIDVYRLIDTKIDFEQATARAEALLGQPYNHSFIKNQPGCYCSEFICEAFKPAAIFHEQPMSFGPRQTVLPEWQAYYQHLGLPIPNGEPGSSPNSLIKENVPQNLQRLGSLAR